MKIKQQKKQKRMPQKENLKLKIKKNCLEAIQLENKTKKLKNKVKSESLRKTHKEFIKKKKN